MAKHFIPDKAGPYKIVTSYAGTPLVLNEWKGKKKVNIACGTWEQAEDICRRLNEDDHNGTIHA